MASNNLIAPPISTSPTEPGAAAQAAIRSLVSQARPPASPPPAAGSTPSGPALEFITSEELQEANYPLLWLIPRLLVRGQPAILGGPRKVLKTSILIDLALSLGSRIDAPFLGHFPTETRVRVGLMSGESGEATIQEIARRIASSKSMNLAAAWVHWCFRLPQIGNSEHLAALRTQIADQGLDVVIIDPLYLCLFGVADDANAAGNLFRMGPLLADVSRACLEAGATPILAHHTRKNRPTDQRWEPPELDDLAFAGVQEFARQWLLLGRREAYVPGSGQHQLWLSVGGSVGHSGLWGVDIDEGQYDSELDRTWHVTVNTATETRVATSAARNEQREAVRADQVTADAERIVQFLGAHPRGETLTAIREAIGLSGTRARRAINYLQDLGEVVAVEVCKNGRGHAGYRLARDSELGAQQR